MINQLCFLLLFLLVHPTHSYSRNAPSVLLAQDSDFDDSVLKDIEDIEVEDTHAEGDEDEDLDEDLDEEDEDLDEEDEDLDEEDEDLDEEDEDLDEEDEDLDEDEDLEEDLDEDEDLEEDLDEDEDLEEDLDEEEDLEEDLDEDEDLEEDLDEEEDLEEDLDEDEDLEEDLDEEEDLEEDLDEEEDFEEDLDEDEDLEEDLDEEEDFEEDLDEEEDLEEDLDEEAEEDTKEDSKIILKPMDEEEALPEEDILPGEEAPVLEDETLPGDEESPLEDEALTGEDEPYSEEALPDDEETSPTEKPFSDQTESVDDTSRENLNIIGNIRYIAAEDRIVIDSSEVISYQVRHNRKNNQIIIEILQARLTENLQWPYILKDFKKTGFGMIQADAKDSSTVRILIQVKENYPMPLIILGEKGDQMIATFQGVSSFGQTHKMADSTGKKGILPAQTLEDFYFGKLDFSGHPLSFHVIDAPIKQVLRFISEESGLNMVIDESVTGSVTMKLENIPWDQAFHTILKVKDLGYIGQGNVVMISSLSALQTKTNKLKELVESTKALSPFQTKVIPVSYGKISDIVSKIKPFLTKAGKGGGKKGETIIHEESGTLVIIDTEKTIKRVEQLVSFLDKPPKQVMIEARIVDAVETFTEDFGLSWSMTGNLPVTVNLRKWASLLTGSWNISDNGRQSGLNVYGVPLIGDVGASLRLAETKGLARVISSPKIVTISGKSASINRNSPILLPKSVTTNTGNPGVENESLEPLDIQISLTVTPHITPSGSVFMQVQITRSSPGPKAGERGQATSTQRSAQTQVLVKNGHTIVIGGIYQYDENTIDAGLPFLRHIPFLKFLFGKTSFETAKSELLVFLTPKLIDSINN